MAAARAQLFSKLTHKGRTSPDNTASSFDADRDAIHSTVQFDNTNSTIQSLPSRRRVAYGHSTSQSPDNSIGSDAGSEMSIEVGRGLKKIPCDKGPTSGQNFVVQTDNGSFYEVTRTPQLGPQDNKRKTENGMKRQTSSRHVAGTANTAEPIKRTMSTTGKSKTNDAVKNTSVTKQPSLSLASALKQFNEAESVLLAAEDNTQNSNNTFNARNTRFTSARQTSAAKALGAYASAPANITSDPARLGHKEANNPTTQSNSFVVPSLPHLDEFISGHRNNGTPVFTRITQPASRFSIANCKPSQLKHGLVKTTGIPEDEKAVYASLQLTKDRVDSLVREVSEAQVRAEEYESEIRDLRSQLSVIHNRADSALGSDDEDMTGHEKWDQEKKSLQASVQTLQERNNRSERKISISEIAVQRITKERDDLVTQIGVAYFHNEELQTENAAFRESHTNLQTENQELKDEVDGLRKELQDIRLLMKQMQTGYEQEGVRRDKVEDELRLQLKEQNKRDSSLGLSMAKNLTQSYQDSTMMSERDIMGHRQPARKERPQSASAIEGDTTNDLASRIALEVQKNRERSHSQPQPVTAKLPSGSKYAGRHQLPATQQKASTAERPASPTGSIASEAESTTHLQLPERAINIPKRRAVDTEDEQELTVLTKENTVEMNMLRQEVENSRSRGGKVSTSIIMPEVPPILREEIKKLAREQRERSDARRALLEKATSNHTAKANNGKGYGTQLTARTIKDLQANIDGSLLRNKLSAEMQREAPQPETQSLPRKSSMKDVTNRIDDGTGPLKSVRVQSPHTSDEISDHRQQDDLGDTSFASNTSRRRRSAESAEAITSEFILPDIMNSFQSISKGECCTEINLEMGRFGQKARLASEQRQKEREEKAASEREERERLEEVGLVPMPVPVSDREQEEDPDVTSATIRPSEPPHIALARVIDGLQEEVKELKKKLAVQHRFYSQHDPGVSRRRRVEVKGMLDKLTAEIELRSNQIYD